MGGCVSEGSKDIWVAVLEKAVRIFEDIWGYDGTFLYVYGHLGTFVDICSFLECILFSEKKSKYLLCIPQGSEYE